MTRPTTRLALLSRLAVSLLAPGQFVHPLGIAVDTAGNVYVLDNQSNRVQKFGEPATGVQTSSWGRLKTQRR